MDKFISIGVRQGDAFYLERGGKKLLVDGGRSRRGFAEQFERTVGATSVDVLVCTHADADHVNGLIGFFDSGFTAREVWLPGSWTSRLKDLLTVPEEFFEEILKQIEALEEFDASNLEELADYYYQSEEIWSTQDNEQRCINVEEIYDAIEQTSPNHYLFGRLHPLYWFEYWLFAKNRSRFKLFIDAIDTAEKIRKLAILSYHSGAKIRWFEFDGSQAPSGGEAYLRPVNSREIIQTSKYRDALMYLSLSKANRESLVFYSPTPDSSCDVLFSADSDFSFQQKLPNIGRGSIVTAPHHGSENNRNAYITLQNQSLITRKSIFVRSDGRFKSRPGATYKSSVAKRACTLCRHPDTERQDIVFNSSQSGWRRKKGGVWCHCM